MKEFTYSQLVSMMSYYLWRYPSVAVALECVLEDVEGEDSAVMAKEVRVAMDRVNGGEQDYEVLLDWASKTGSRDLENFALKIQEAHEKKQDIGHYVRRFVPVVLTNKDKDHKRYNNEKKHYEKRRNKKPYHRK